MPVSRSLTRRIAVDLMGLSGAIMGTSERVAADFHTIDQLSLDRDRNVFGY